MKTAEVATSAIAAMSAVSTLNGVRPQLDRGRRLLHQALADVVFYARTPIEVPSKPTRPRRQPATPVLEQPKQQELEADQSAWEPSSPRDASRCKALLLEVLRRAAHDWVLYRGHTKLQYRELAEDAFVWLFEEDEGHLNFRTRLGDMDEGGQVGTKVITSFVSICEALDLDIDTVRDRVRGMDARSITAAGRPAETRRIKRNDSVAVEECEVTINVDMDSMADPNHTTHYESYGSVETPDRLYPLDFAQG